MKSPAILRILTKWSEELENNFKETEEIYLKQAEDIAMQDGSFTIFTTKSKKGLV